jgi:hypothetical protein
MSEVGFRRTAKFFYDQVLRGSPYGITVALLLLERQSQINQAIAAKFERRHYNLVSMKRKPVESSVMISTGYDRKTLTLEIEFTSRDIWQYYQVPERVYLDMINSGSLGKFFNEHIKGLYREMQIR